MKNNKGQVEQPKSKTIKFIGDEELDNVVGGAGAPPPPF